MIRIRSPTFKRKFYRINTLRLRRIFSVAFLILEEKMNKEMININANLIKEPTFGSFMKDDKEVQVANFTLAKGYGKGKEYINCAAYGDKAEAVKEFKEDDFIHIYGYFIKRVKNGKTYKNFINVLQQNQKERRERGGINYGIFRTGSKCIKDFSYGSRSRTWSMGCYQSDGRLW